YELGEVRARRTRIGRARADALREEKEQWHARGPRREEPQQIERRRVGVMQVLEDVEERTRACERDDEVVDRDEHRALPLFGVGGRLGRARKVGELRED